MRIFLTLIFSIFIFSSLHASGPYTLSKLECVKIQTRNKTQIFNEQDLLNIENLMKETLKSTELRINEMDCSPLRITLRAIEEDPNFYIYIKLNLREDVTTNRDTKTKTFALTYSALDFIKSQDVHEDVLDSVEALVEEFIKHYKEDNEEYKLQ